LPAGARAIRRRATSPRLVAQRPDAVLKKIGEEATEVVMACKDGERDRIIAEVADLVVSHHDRARRARPRAG